MSGWGALSEDLDRVAALVERAGRAPTIRAQLDQDAAAIRDELDSLGVTVADPDAVRAGLAFLHLLVERVHHHAWVTGAVSADTIVGAVRNGIIAGVLDHVPAEERS